MDSNQTQTVTKDQVNEDFKNATYIVSLLANLVVFVTWLTIELS